MITLRLFTSDLPRNGERDIMHAERLAGCQTLNNKPHHPSAPFSRRRTQVSDRSLTAERNVTTNGTKNNVRRAPTAVIRNRARSPTRQKQHTLLTFGLSRFPLPHWWHNFPNCSFSWDRWWWHTWTSMPPYRPYYVGAPSVHTCDTLVLDLLDKLIRS